MSTFDILFLGTCAANFSPRLKTDLANCFDKDARRSSSVLLDGRFLIDCGKHTAECLRIAQTDVTKITDIFITHTHYDHFMPEVVESVARLAGHSLRLWINESADIPEITGVQTVRIPLFEELTVCDGLTLSAVRANHDPNAAPVHYLFKKGDKKLLYACDGAWLLTDSYNYLKNAQLDVAILDATCGDYVGDWRMAEHNSIPMIRLMLPSMKNFGIIKDDTVIYLSHLAPSLHKSHEETQQLVKPDGLLVAYDGLSVQI